MNVDLTVNGGDFVCFVAEPTPADRRVNLWSGKAALCAAFCGERSGQFEIGNSTNRVEIADIDVVDHVEAFVLQIDRAGSRALPSGNVKPRAFQIERLVGLIECAFGGHRCAWANQSIERRIAEVNPGSFNIDIEGRKPIGRLLNVNLAVDGRDFIRLKTQATSVYRCIDLRSGEAAFGRTFCGDCSGQINTGDHTDRLQIADIDIIDHVELLRAQIDGARSRAFGGGDVETRAFKIEGLCGLVERTLCGY